MFPGQASTMRKQNESRERQTLVGVIHPDVLSFTVGLDPRLDLQLVEHDCLGSAAHVTMLSRIPVKPVLFDTQERRAVIDGLVEIMRAARRGNFSIANDDQDVHLAVERRLTERLGDLGRRIHTGRSRNDQVAVDLRLHAREHLLALQEEAAELVLSMLAFARRHRHLPMVGRTHLQPAMPSSVGLWASGHAEGFLDDLPLLSAAYEYADRCPLGSAAGYGVPLPLDRDLTSRLLGFAVPHHNVFHASNTRGKLESVILGALAQVMLTASRLAEDLILFTMPEFGYFSLPHELCTGSSIMPQKRNPDVLELIRAKTARLLGHQTAAGAIVKALPGGYNRDLQETKEIYMDGMAVTRATLRILKLMTNGLEAHPDRLRSAFTPDVFATDRALDLVAGGMPFRAAYQQVRENLAALSNADPQAALAAKTHLGGTAGLDFKALAQRARAASGDARRRTKTLHKTFARLLGVNYPELTPPTAAGTQGATKQ